MKTVFFEDLKTITEKEPIYSVLSKTPQKNGDPRAIGCCPLAFLNLLMLVKKRMGIDQEQTAHDILFDEVLTRVEEQDDLSVPFPSALSFTDTHPIFNGWKALVLNPSAMTAEIFWQIALRRLLDGDIVLCLLEVQESGAAATKQANHISVVHSDNGEVFYDGVRMTADTLTNILFFSPVNTLVFFSPPVEVSNE